MGCCCFSGKSPFNCFKESRRVKGLEGFRQGFSFLWGETRLPSRLPGMYSSEYSFKQPPFPAPFPPSPSRFPSSFLSPQPPYTPQDLHRVTSQTASLNQKLHEPPPCPPLLSPPRPLPAPKSLSLSPLHTHISLLPPSPPSNTAASRSW